MSNRGSASSAAAGARGNRGSTSSAADLDARTDGLPRGVAGLGLLLVTLSGALSALLECCLVPLYAGTTVLPVAVLMALVLNVLLPVLGTWLVPRTIAAVAPFAAWLVVVIVLGVLTRPEGDVLLPGGGPGGVVWVTYGVLLGGAVVGGATVVVRSAPPAPANPVGSQRVSR